MPSGPSGDAAMIGPRLERVTRWLAGGAYVVCALLVVALLFRVPSVSTVLPEAAALELRDAPPVILLIVMAWLLIGAGLVKNNGFALLLALLPFPMVALVSWLIGESNLVVTTARTEPEWWPLAARAPFQVLAQLWHGGRWTSTPAGPAWMWLAFGAHTLLLGPQIHGGLVLARTRLRARWRQRRRRATVRLPESCVRLYPDNAFQTLGLMPHETTTRSLIRRRDELLTLLEADMPFAEGVANFFQVGWPGRPAPDRSSISRAVARLQSEPDRKREELFWFQLEGEEEAVLSALRAGHLEDAERTWQSSRNNGVATPVGTRALKNLAVVAHQRALAVEEMQARRSGLGAAAMWRTSLALWNEVAQTPQCWRPPDRSRTKGSHHDSLEEWQWQLAVCVLGVHADIAGAAANQGFTTYAKAHLELIRESTFPVASKEHVLSSFFSGRLAEARRLLQPLLLQSENLTASAASDSLNREYRSLREDLRALGEETRLANLASEAVSAACTKLRNEINAAHHSFADTDLACFRVNGALVEQWNHSMNEYNRLPAFLDRGAFEQLRLVHRLMSERRSSLVPVEKAVDELAARVTRLHAIARFLEYVGQDAGEDVRERIRAEVKNATEALEHARTEFGKTRDHFERNLAGMARNVGQA